MSLPDRLPCAVALLAPLRDAPLSPSPPAHEPRAPLRPAPRPLHSLLGCTALLVSTLLSGCQTTPHPPRSDWREPDFGDHARSSASDAKWERAFQGLGEQSGRSPTTSATLNGITSNALRLSPPAPHAR